MALNETKRCSGCHQDLPLSEFWKNRSSPDGLQAYCKACGKAKAREHQKANPELYREISKRSWHKHREKRLAGEEIRADKRHLFLDSLKTPCAKCGEQRVYLLDFHHIDPSQKLFTLGDGRKYHKSENDVIAESKNCVCLCANCHREFHYLYGQQMENPVDNLNEYLSGRLQFEYTLQGVRADLSEEKHNAV